MKVGALVRCREFSQFPKVREEAPFSIQGVLVEYNKLMKTATVLVDGQTRKFRAHDVQLVKNP
tara:strand:+ start:395 stop:583 length:189 start_codon:yes stop_codon:yes gene_type:complete